MARRRRTGSRADRCGWSSVDTAPEINVTVTEALRSFAFWGSVIAAGIRNGSYHALAVHFIPLMVWKGLSQSEAALLLSVYAFLAWRRPWLWAGLPTSRTSRA